MVNVSTSYGNYCVTLGITTRTVGKDQHRKAVIAELWRDGQLVATGLSLCHPTDAFNPRKGAHLAVSKMCQGFFEAEDKAAIHKKIDRWFK